MSIESFAAVVSDNDGASFITKAEFDSLKNNFQSEINRFTENIDVKIDNAIASYLAGVGTDSQEVNALPLRDWKTVTMINGIIKPEFAYPSININAFLMGGFGEYNGKKLVDNPWVNQYWAYGNAVYDQDVTVESTRPTVTNIRENGNDDTKMTWDGVKSKWRESINATASFFSVDNLWAFEIAGYDNRFFLSQMTYFEGPGYRESLDNGLTDYWKVSYGYYSNYSSYGYRPFVSDANGGSLNNSLVFAIACDSKKDYEHICNWSNSYKNWEVYNENFVNTMRFSRFDVKTSNELFGLCTKKGQWYGEKWSGNISTSRPKAKWANLTINNKTITQADIDKKIPRIGLYNTSVEPKKILQTNDNYSQLIDGTSYLLPKLNLINGFVVGYAKKGDEIAWDPIFCEVSSPDVGVCDGSEEVCLMLSLKPFEEGGSTGNSSNDDLISIYNFGSETTTKYPISQNKQFKIKFIMPQDGFVIAKWFPKLINESYIDTKDWRVDLNLNDCGTYIRKKAK